MGFIVHPSKILRDDGTHIAVFRETNLWSELKETAVTALDRRYMILAPAQIACEMALALVSSVNCK